MNVYSIIHSSIILTYSFKGDYLFTPFTPFNAFEYIWNLFRRRQPLIDLLNPFETSHRQKPLMIPGDV